MILFSPSYYVYNLSFSLYKNNLSHIISVKTKQSYYDHAPRKDFEVSRKISFIKKNAIKKLNQLEKFKKYETLVLALYCYYRENV